MRSVSRHLALLPALLLATVPLAAQDGADRGVATLEVRAGRDALTNGVSPWQDQSVALRYSATNRTGLGVTGERIQRFGAQDQRLFAEASVALGKWFTLGLEGEASSTHRMVPRQGGGAQLHIALPAGWGVNLRGNLRRYDQSDVRGGALSLEKYWGNNMVSYTANPVQLAELTPVTTHSARFTHYFGVRGSVTLMGSAGKEVEALSATGPLVAPVQGGGMWGVLPLAPHLALVWGGDVSRHEGFFTRKRVSVGARLATR